MVQILMFLRRGRQNICVHVAFSNTNTNFKKRSFLNLCIPSFWRTNINNKNVLLIYKMTELTESITRLNEFYETISNVSTNNSVSPQERVNLNSATVQENIKKLSKEELIERRNELKKVLDAFASEIKTQEVTDGIAEVTQKNEDSAAKRAAQNKEPSALESMGINLFSKKPVEPVKKELSIVAKFYDDKIKFNNLLKDLNKEIEKKAGTGTGTVPEKGGRRKPCKSKRTRKSKRNRKSKRSRRY